jgi:hypothetical protein
MTVKHCPTTDLYISILPAQSKAMEIIVRRQLTCCVERNDMISQYQSGLRVNHSTNSTLLRITKDLLIASEENYVSVHNDCITCLIEDLSRIHLPTNYTSTHQHHRQIWVVVESLVSQKVKRLGLMVHQNLTWSDQINKICRNVFFFTLKRLWPMAHW